MNQSLIQLVLTRQQLHESATEFIFGSGEIARYARSQLRSYYRDRVTFVDRRHDVREFDGRPLISFRTFCRNSVAGSVVIFATEDSSMLAGLVAAGQKLILDVREYFASERHARRDSASCNARLAVISTVPRSGTYRLSFFLYALNEYRARGIRQLDARKLFLYQLSAWGNPSSSYHLKHVFELLRADTVRLGHYMPLGALSSLSNNPAVVKVQQRKQQRFQSACSAVPCLSSISFPTRPLHMEPHAPVNRNWETRYALIARDVLDQISSILTLYELIASKLRERGAVRWSTHEYVRHCYGHFRPFVFSGIDGQVPLLFAKSIGRGTRFVDVVIEEGHLRSLVEDYALQTYACEFFERYPCASIRAKAFSYDAMINAPDTFFLDLTSFLRGNSLTAQDERAIQRAYTATNRAQMREMEKKLGHGLSYSDRVAQLAAVESHMTDEGGDSHNIAETKRFVISKVREQEVLIRALLAETLSAMRAGAAIAPALGFAETAPIGSKSKGSQDRSLDVERKSGAS